MTNAAACQVGNNFVATPETGPRLPKTACLPINRCSLPAAILGGLTFQRHPTFLLLDGVAELHADLFPLLDVLADPLERARRFMDYMTVHFRLEALEEAGLTADAPRGRLKLRGRADYLRMVRGWAFDPNGREGAVLKAWVESRFGLLTRFHGVLLDDRAEDAYEQFMVMCSRGLYNTNALEAQLDLLYTYCQYELNRREPDVSHLTLYRGFNRLSDDQVLVKLDRRRWVVLLNNLSSFSARRERAEEFGDHLMRVTVSAAKLFFHNRLLPGMLKGEDEYVVIGGVYEVERLA
ncbi:MAG TPA: NAD(+)--dinitrogen-reductase ADP-D-ribosyltransferase [Candidatus Competibacter sp.]|nr:NAD(+)--dinitrogen-reductase ADP-D-ribosyltransferase [Candidatus Competibacteraceae bacterium]HRE55448.1 NAD(+)--dinitrogen-reductase ADP-D-ribosyltransferase [Candidatus Competibacter sp.]HUM95437.1 NAD(+)--dinitrogen-reductase ADP-D-ribosyltransferase [Candidatus Competibacter sp.]